MKLDKKIEENSIVRLDIEVEWKDILDDFEKFIRHFAKHIKEPGFRAGKVPVSLLKKKYKKEIEADFVDDKLSTIYKEAIDQADIDPVDSGKVVDVEFAEGESLKLGISVQVEPEFQLPALKKNSLKAVKKIVEVTDEDVDTLLENLREQFADVKESNTPAREGDFLEVDIQELDESNIPIIGKKLEKRLIKIGEGKFGGDAKEQLLGAKASENRVVNVKEEHGDHSHDFRFMFTINKVEEHILPELTDEFAQKVNKKFKTVEDLRAGVKDDITANYDQETQKMTDSDLANSLVKMTEIDTPEAMITSYVDGIIEQAKNSGQQDIDESFIRTQYRESAIWSIKWLMIRKALFRENSLEVTEEDIDSVIDSAIRTMGDQPALIARMKADEEYRNRTRQDLTESRVMEILRGYAKYEEKKMSTSEFQAENSHNH